MPLNTLTEHSPGRVFLEYLRELSLVSYVSNEDWEGFADYRPDDSDGRSKMVTCRSTTPVNQGTLQGSGRVVQQYGVQVAAESPQIRDYSKVAQIQVSVADSSNSPLDFSIDYTHYRLHRAVLDSGPLYGGRDKAGQYKWTLNYLLSLSVLED